MKFIVKAYMKNKIIIQLVKASNAVQAEEKFMMMNSILLNDIKRFVTKEKKWYLRMVLLEIKIYGFCF